MTVVCTSNFRPKQLRSLVYAKLWILRNLYVSFGQKCFFRLLPTGDDSDCEACDSKCVGDCGDECGGEFGGINVVVVASLALGFAGIEKNGRCIEKNGRGIEKNGREIEMIGWGIEKNGRMTVLRVIGQLSFDLD
nr:hypothetical protein [Tanacetum cinerariifolium]